MKIPLTSVIIPLFNKEKEVLRAVNSVLKQTVQDFEIIIVNDGSTDKGPEIVKSISDHRVKVLDQPTSGVSAARNRGIAFSRAELIAFLDADDEWDSSFLEQIKKLRECFRSSEVFATNYFFCKGSNYRRPAILRGLPQGFSEGILLDYFKIASQSDPPLWTSAVAVTKKALQSIGGFPVGVASGEDLLTWARLAVKYDIAYSIEPMAYFWEPDNVSDRPGRIPDINDYVGNQLELLLQNCKYQNCNELKNYIGLWHKNCASIYLRLGEKRLALKEAFKSAKFAGISVKLILYMLGTALPLHISNALMKEIKNRITKAKNGVYSE
jgi:glycosyltransferase involved in cell wall biosynthesis